MLSYLDGLCQIWHNSQLWFTSEHVGIGKERGQGRDWARLSTRGFGPDREL